MFAVNFCYAFYRYTLGRAGRVMRFAAEDANATSIENAEQMMKYGLRELGTQESVVTMCFTVSHGVILKDEMYRFLWDIDFPAKHLSRVTLRIHILLYHHHCNAFLATSMPAAK